MDPALQALKMLEAFLGSLMVLSLVMRISATENRPLLFGAIGVIVLSATAIWIGMGNRTALSRRAWQLAAWAGMLILFAVLQMRGWAPRSPMSNRQEIINELLVPLAIVIVATIAAGSVAGGILRHKRQRDSPDLDNGNSPA